MPGRLVVRRIPDLNPGVKDGQATLFDTWRFHGFFTTTAADEEDTVAADMTHRGHAIIEQVHSDLKNSALAHPPSASFTANAAWLVLAVMAFNLTRAAATITGPGPRHDGHDPAHAHRRPRPDRVLGTASHAAPTDRVAMGNRLDTDVHSRLRTTDAGHLLTTQPLGATGPARGTT